MVLSKLKIFAGCLFIVKDGVNMHKGYKLHANPYYEQVCIIFY